MLLVTYTTVRYQRLLPTHLSINPDQWDSTGWKEACLGVRGEACRAFLGAYRGGLWEGSRGRPGAFLGASLEAYRAFLA